MSSLRVSVRAGKPPRRSSTRSPPIEIDRIDREAVLSIVAFLRELAVTLPADSRLPLKLADTAKRMEARNANRWANENAVHELRGIDADS